MIDGNDNISMRGKAGVIIMVDGKPSPMSGADLVNYLRSLPSNAIERIELITNPSSRYDAAGNAGIIDIRMKKTSALGRMALLPLVMGKEFIQKQMQVSILITGITKLICLAAIIMLTA